MNKKLIIIGAGPGGYAAAFYAGDCGLDVTLIDSRDRLGGVCLNEGCIPSKALLHCGQIIKESKGASKMGISYNDPQIDLDQMRMWKDGIITRLTNGLDHLAKKRNVNFICGTASFINSNTINIKSLDGTEQQLDFDHAIIATGSRPNRMPNQNEHPRLLNSTTALELKSIPTSLLVIGGGYIGLELGSIYANLGSDVSVVEMMPALLNDLDDDCTKLLTRQLKKTFKKIWTSTKLSKLEVNDDGVAVELSPAGKTPITANFDKVLVSIGRTPNTSQIGLEKADITVDQKGFIDVNGTRQTSAQNIYAIGDVTGNPTLAHKASAEARVAVDAILGKEANFNPTSIPAVVFTDPECAVCGLTEKEALKQNHDIKISIFPWSASGRALTLNQTQGMTKLIVEAQTEIILGATIVGPHAGDLISEVAVAIKKQTTAKELAHTIHPHPTLSETIMEAAENIFGTATHL